MQTILLVDDNSFERRALGNLLKATFLDIELEETDSGYEAMEILKKKDVDLLITDIKMPLVNGIELIKLVRNFDKKINIVVVSGYDNFEYAKKLLPFHVDNYLLKPINPLELKDTISSLLSEEKGGPEYSQVIKQVLNIIKKEYSNGITLESVADQVYLSPPYLGVLFNKETGTSFNHYLTEIRLRRAAELLKSSNIRIANIAAYVGISNPSYFNKLFKKKYDMTPAEYRKKEEV